MRQEQLPPAVEVYENDITRKRGIFDDFPSVHQTTCRSSRLAVKNSETQNNIEVSFNNTVCQNSI